MLASSASQPDRHPLNSIYNHVLVLDSTCEVGDERPHVNDSPALPLVESGCPTPKTQWPLHLFIVAVGAIGRRVAQKQTGGTRLGESFNGMHTRLRL